MKILIEGYNKSIHKRDNQILIKEKEDELEKINIKRIDDITIIGKGSVTFDALRLISDNNIPLMSIDYFGKINYILEYPKYENIFLRKKQYEFSENHQGLTISREIIRSKLLNQRFTIRTLNKSKNIDDVKFYENKINESVKSLDKLRFGPNVNVSNAKNKIMGIEGNASTYYWMAISEILPDEVKFYQRVNRFPDDITNAMLNYGYAILASEVTKHLVLNRLDPYCGFLHFDRDRRTSLTFDLIEEFRQQLVDKVVFSLINTGQITNDDLDKRNDSISLEKRKLIIAKILDKVNSKINFEGENLTYGEIIDKQAQKIVNSLVNDEEYGGFYLRW